MFSSLKVGTQHNVGGVFHIPLFSLFFKQAEKLFFWLEHILPYSTNGTHPIFRKIFESCSRFNSAIRVSLCRVIHIPTYCADIFFHMVPLLKNGVSEFTFIISMALLKKQLGISPSLP
jgi:hypothetical protein